MNIKFFNFILLLIISIVLFKTFKEKNFFKKNSSNDNTIVSKITSKTIPNKKTTPSKIIKPLITDKKILNKIKKNNSEKNKTNPKFYNELNELLNKTQKKLVSPKKQIKYYFRNKIKFKKLYQKFFKRKKIFDYRKAREILYAFEKNNNNYIECYYSGKKFSYNGIFGNYNCEHIWPQSKMNNKEKQRTDIHNLIPTDKSINNLRGNYPFGEATISKSKSILKNGVFEVRNKSKGNVARTMFYFSVMYDLPIDDRQERILRRWNKLDKVDKNEKIRNKIIAQYQGNKNIFIEKPELIDSISDF